MKKNVLYTVACLLLATSLTAQPHFGNEQGNLNYRFNEMLINPATTASQDSINLLSLGLRMQWMDMDGGPFSQTLQFQTPSIGTKTGLGLSLYNDSYAINSNTQFSAHYAYKIKMKIGTFSLGLQAGVLTSGVKAVTDINDPLDPAFAEGASRSWGFNAGFGAYYHTDSWFAGFSIPQLLTNDYELNDNDEQKLKNAMEFDRLQYYFTGGSQFLLSSKMTLRPTVLLELSSSTSLGYEVMLIADYAKRFEFGVGMSANTCLQIAAGVVIARNFALNYQYSQYLGSSYKNISGMHFIGLQYRWHKR